MNKQLPSPSQKAPLKTCRNLCLLIVFLSIYLSISLSFSILILLSLFISLFLFSPPFLLLFGPNVVYIFLGNEVVNCKCLLEIYWRGIWEKKTGPVFSVSILGLYKIHKGGNRPWRVLPQLYVTLSWRSPQEGLQGRTSLVAMLTSALEACDSFSIGWNCPQNFPPQKVEAVLSAALGLVVFHEESISETNQERKSWWLNISSGSHKLRLTKSEL